MTRHYGRHDWRLPDSMPAAESGQRLIGDYRSASRQFFMDPDQIAFGSGHQLQDLLAEGFRFFRTFQQRYFHGLGLQNFAHTFAGDLHRPRNLPSRYFLSVQFQNRCPLSFR